MQNTPKILAGLHLCLQDPEILSKWRVHSKISRSGVKKSLHEIIFMEDPRVIHGDPSGSTDFMTFI